jgi:LPS export ABC transporter protein LptC
MRRFLIGVIILVLLLVLGNYFYSRRNRSNSSTDPRRILSSEMVQLTEGFEFSQNKGGAARFKIRAEKLLETRNGKNYLQGFEIFNFNPDGSIQDTIQSQKAQYDRERMLADLSGDVRIQLSKGIELQTNTLHYDQNTNIGTTDDRLQLRSSTASGTALGIRFDEKDKSLDLNRDVDFVMIQKRTKPDGATENVKIHVTSEKAFLSESMLLLRFQGKAHVDAGSEALSGDEIEATLSENKEHFRTLTSTGHAAYQFKETNQTRNMSGDRIAFGMDEISGDLQNVRVLGQAAFSSTSKSGEMALNAAEIYLELEPASGLPITVQSNTGVQFRTKSGSEQKTISGNQLQATFARGTKNLESIRVSKNASINEIGKDLSENMLQAEEIHLSFTGVQDGAALDKLQAEGSAKWISSPSSRSESAKTLEASWLELKYSGAGNYPESGFARGNVSLIAAPDGSPNSPQLRQLLSDYLRFAFYPRGGGLKDMYAEGHVRVNYEKTPAHPGNPGMENFHTESDKMKATFLPSVNDGAIEKAVQWGNFHYKDDSKNATAGKCDYESKKGILVLTESPEITDSHTGVTSGDKIEYDQNRKILFVHRGVKSVLSSKKGDNSFWGSSESSSPVVITADEMEYSSESGLANYTGNVMLLSAEQILQSKQMEILKDGEQVSAQGGIRHYVNKNGTASSTIRQRPSPKKAIKSGDMPIRVQSARLRYVKETNIITYFENVLLNSADYNISSGTMDVEWEKEEKSIKRAVARENVVIHQGNRVCSGEVGYYLLDPERFEVTGDPARINDPGKEIRSSAPRLTFFIADERTMFENR